MKINGGKYRGKALFSPQSDAVRPTSDRMREAVFNILRSRFGFDFSGKVFFDVFSGSGAMGLEAVSQGFGKVFFFDVDLTAALKNIRRFPDENTRIETVGGDVLRVLPPSKKADVLFMDAPYRQGLSEPALKRLAEDGFLNGGALCLVEVEKNESCVLPEQYELLDERRYGLARLIIARFRA